MDSQSLFFVLVAVLGIANVTADIENRCLDASYCKLIMGDVARESDKYGKDPTKFYQQAEEGVTLFKKYNQSPDKAVKEVRIGSHLSFSTTGTRPTHICTKQRPGRECDRLESTCAAEVAKMAVEELKFPAKYETTCNYESYSRTVFDCKNIKLWPQSIKDTLPKTSKTCNAECLIVEDTNITLSTGKVVNNPLTGLHPTGDSEIDGMEAQQRVIDLARGIEVQYSAFDDDLGKPGWGELDVCPIGTWVAGADKITKGDYLFYVKFLCNSIVLSTTRPLSYQSGAQIQSTVLGVIPPVWGANYSKGALAGCGGTYYFLTGISINTKQYKTYGKIPLYVNYICANVPKWSYPRENGYLETAVPDSRELHCPIGTAICSIRTRSDTFENVKFVIDVRIGCCKGHPDYNYLYQRNDIKVVPLPPVTPPPIQPITPPPIQPITPPPIQPITPPPTQPVTPPPNPTTTNETGDDLLNLQKKSGDYYLFWDESEVLNDIITRYNIYYSPATLDNEDAYQETKCPPGQFIGSYELSDPKSCYFQGRRIPRVVFNCTDKACKKGDKLDIYGRLKNGHTLQDEKYFDSKACTCGFYTGIEFTYYVDKEYPYLVNAWGLKMKCSSNGTTSDHESVIKAYPTLDLAAHKPEKATVDCGAGKAICGFQNKVADNHSGVFEGLYFKVVCCSV